MGFDRFAKDMRIKYKLVCVFLALLLPILALGGTISYLIIKKSFETQMTDVLRQNTEALKGTVNTAATVAIRNYLKAIAEQNRNMVAHYYQLMTSGVMDRDTAVRIITETLAAQTIGDTGYIFCLDSKGVAFYHPKEGVQGTNLSDYPFIAKQLEQKEGYLEYSWKNPGENTERPKALYMAYFEPLDWVISVSAYREEFRRLIRLEDIDRVVHSGNVGTYGYSFIMDSSGKHVHDASQQVSSLPQRIPPDAIDEMLRRKNGIITYPWLSPDTAAVHSMKAFFHYLPEFDWVVGSAYSENEFSSLLSALGPVILVTALLTVLATFLVSFWIGSRTNRAVQSLIVQFEKGAEGEFDARLPVASKDELGVLARHFNSFMARLGAYRDGLLSEVEKRRSSEKELREYERRMKAFVQNAPVVFWETDIQGNLTFYHNRLSRQLGIEANSQYIDSLKAHPQWPQIEAHFQTAMSGTPVSLQLRSPGRVTELYYSPATDESGAITGAVGISIDITERVEAEKRLADSEKKYRQLYESCFDGFIITDRERRITECNGAFERMLGYSREELIGRSIVPFTPPQWHESQKKYFDTLRRRGYSDIFEKEYIRKDGSLVPVELRFHAMVDEAGEQTGYWAFVRDNSKRKESEREIQKLAMAVEQTSEMVVITDTDGVIEYVNPSFEAVTGYVREEVTGQKPSILKSNRHSPAFYATLWRTISGGETWAGRFVNRKKNGDLFYEDAIITPLRDNTGKVIRYVASKRDVTPQVKMETQLRQAQRMEAIGSLAGGIAHDFNNILSGIMGYTEICMFDTPQGSTNHVRLEKVLQAAHRAKDLIHHIQVFSRQAVVEAKPILLHSVVREAMKLLRAAIPASVEFIMNIENVGVMLADPTQIHQIVMNLCTNAYHAMKEAGGLLTVSLTKEAVPDSSTLLPGGRAENYARLSVTDTGCGIPERILEKIFDPYFTTKPEGEGTGLGLSVVHGIIKGLSGSIEVYSKEGEGTTFHVYFPLRDMAAAPPEAETVIVRGNGEVVLVVDDDVPVLEIITEMLTSLNYQPVPRSSPREALAFFKTDPNRFRVVLTDFTMPNMSGLQLAEAVREIAPAIPVILCSGFSHSDAVEAAVRQGMIRKLDKPIILSALAEAVAACLKP